MEERKALKVLMVNTSERTGGAAIAADRLRKALLRAGVDVDLCVRTRRWGYLFERLRILWANGLSTHNLWQIDIANAGEDITTTEAFRQADVIHIHWINQGFLSLKTLERVLCSGKRIIWTLHDEWPFAGICHYAGNCPHFQVQCHNCPLLRHPGKQDLSYRVFMEKRSIYRRATHLTFVGCSKWITNQARLSNLTQFLEVVNIANPIDRRIFHPMPQAEARRRAGLGDEKRRLIFFGCQRVADERKGMKYLMEALQRLQTNDVALVVAGDSSGLAWAGGPDGRLPVLPVGYVSDEAQMAALYASADVFVTPSLEDNLPNTIAEAMSCGTPCVGFRTGGVPEMIGHKRGGYVAQLRDVEDLSRGIHFVLSHPELRTMAAERARECYDEDRIVQAYLKLYNER